ncbi:MAG: peptidylprolyl isomerase [Dehalococcoidia bacterium]|nr:peptidylprolyl isomerase [Dehalococcoidia bacterium]
MAKRRRRAQQHLGQESSRRRTSGSNTIPTDVYKPGFPMNLFSNIGLFAVIGSIAAVVMVAAAFLTTTGGNETADPLPTPTVTPTPDPNATPTPTPEVSPTPAVKQFTAPESVVDATKFKYEAVVKTSKGEFVIALDVDRAPETVNSFVFLAKQDYFDGITFHRIVSNFVIQSGDPLGTGAGGPGYTMDDEPNEVSNKRGTISMAKRAGATEFGSQWFINLKDNPSLDYTNPGDKFYPFGQVTSGLDVVDAIGRAGSAQGTPTEQVTITDIEIREVAR